MSNSVFDYEAIRRRCWDLGISPVYRDLEAEPPKPKCPWHATGYCHKPCAEYRDCYIVANKPGA